MEAQDGRQRVATARCDSYEALAVKSAIGEALGPLGGIERFVGRGDRVLLKPNLLVGRAPEKAVTTHPAIVRAVAEMCLDRGASVAIGDSPLLGNTKSAARRAGIAEVAQALGARIVEFEDPVDLPMPEGRTYRKVQVARAVVETDKIINLPKLKTHGGMFLTLGVKNMFGSIVGTRKGEWHLNSGPDPDNFARFLVDLYSASKPALTLLDGVIGMEGNGPANGPPRKLGRLFASTDAVALDSVVCRFVGADLAYLRTCVLGESLGAGVSDPARIEVVGDGGELGPIEDFQLPPPQRMNTFLFSLFQGRRFRNAMTTRPHVLNGTCDRCELCIRTCPAKAMSWGPPGRGETDQDRSVAIDLGRCTRCFCCQEVCLTGAIVVREGWLLKARSRLLPPNRFVR